MNINKYIRILLISICSFFLFFGFVGCGANFSAIGEGAKMDKTVDTLLEAINENDYEAVKSLFSRDIQEEVGDERFEAGVEYLHTFVDGEIVSKEGRPYSSGETRSGGKKQRQLQPIYKVTTTSDEYRMGFYIQTVDSITPGNTGIFNLWIKKESDKRFTYIREDFKGIYVPRTIDESQKGPREYQTTYGAFTVAAGYCKDDSVSTDDKYYFTVEDVVLSDVIYNYFSITMLDSEYGISEFASFREDTLGYIEHNKAKMRELDQPGFLFGKDTYIAEDPSIETAQGYPLLKCAVVEGSTQIPVDKYYYIFGDRKYVLVQYTETARQLSDEHNEAQLAMIAAVDALVDSFVWAD